ncbi:GtrA family protein [Megasphaera paucivorans]|uniref:Putative flippase GtrA (Transmembrane translocase of bactoprenol-linked glucose) n=1 Tax=Megasphaera paucivorans TaxID=349095 RepID=A0A1G9WL25_9FIRM|nr:GtrA family protein [Megasphaera paucivorans]SDM84943.1 Putative flippase GtrA (transmembrane translocase of bactoprenol-linked glucose) [Megasphaera paucivorans]
MIGKQKPADRDNFKQFLKFGIVGISNTGIAFIVYYSLVFLGIHYLIANIVAWIVSVFNAFYWNSRYVFKTPAFWLKALFKTYISYGISFLLGTGLLYGLVEWGHISVLLAPICTLLITVPVNFLMNKWWTFR